MLEVLLSAAIALLAFSVAVLCVAAANMDRLARQSATQLELSIDVGKKLLVLLDHHNPPPREDRGSGVQRRQAGGVTPARLALVPRDAA